MSVQRMMNKARTQAGQIPALWRGTVVEITAAGVWVTIPRLTGDEPVGPLPTVPAVIVGDRVVIAAIEGHVDDLMVLAVGG